MASQVGSKSDRGSLSGVRETLCGREARAFVVLLQYTTTNQHDTGSNVPESEWEVGDSGNCHECGLSLSWDDCHMSEDLPGDLMLCEGCIIKRQENESAPAPDSQS
eukprot:SAG31_NODE_2721_length_5189_cov_4.868566_6_plen_106_part_00